MKTINSIYHTKTLSVVLSLLTTSILFSSTSVLFTSCEKVDIGTTESEGSGGGSSSKGSHKVTVITRSSTSQDISYPIDIYAYNAQGEVATHQTVNSASDGISMSLNEGQYTIAAISGASQYDKAKGYSMTPIMTGSTTVTVGSSALTANIVMSYAVASLDMSLTDVPSSVTNVTVTVASQYTDISNLREYSGSGSVTIPCSLSSGTWQTGTVYLLPGCKETTNITISLTSPSGTTSYGITYPTALKAATPYHFAGAYSGEAGGAGSVKLTGSLSYDEWLATVDGSFSFGPSGSNSFNGEQPVETIKVSEIPAQGTVWDGHLVAMISNSDSSSADGLLLSITEWSSLTSALYETDPTVAQRLADGYSESDLTGWSIPTTEDIKELRLIWSSENIETLNNALASVNGSSAIAVTGDDGKNVRYLCENACYTYGWAKGANIVAAGKTVKTYRLRVVKKVRFTL